MACARRKSVLSEIYCHTMPLHTWVDGLKVKCNTEPLGLVFVACQHSSQLYPADFTFCTSFTPQDIIHHVIQLSCIEKIENVLAFGHQLLKEGHFEPCLLGTSNIQRIFPSSVITFFKEPCWNVLHDVVGDDLFLHLLGKLSLFLLIGNDCYLQLCGKPASSVMPCHCRLPQRPGKCAMKRLTSESSCSSIFSLRQLFNLHGKRLKVKSAVFDPLPATKRVCLEVPTNVSNPSGDLSKQEATAVRSNRAAYGSARNFALVLKPKMVRRLHNAKNFSSSILQKLLRRSRIFYSKRLSEHFSKRSLLHSSSGSCKGVFEMLNSIFHFNKTRLCSKNVRLPRHLLGLRKHVKRLLRNFKKFKFSKALRYYCSVPQWIRKYSRSISFMEKGWLQQRCGSMKSHEKIKFKFAVKSCIEPVMVFRFLAHVLDKLLPLPLLGSQHNRSVFRKHLKKFVTLGRFEHLSLECVMRGLRVTHMAWLFDRGTQTSGRRCPQQAVKFRIEVGKLIAWIFNFLVVPLIENFFYVTETGVHKGRVVYYRKPVWKVIQYLGLKCLLGKGLNLVAESFVMQKIERGDSLGLSSLRLLPEPTKVRPIINMAKREPSKNLRANVPVNAQLRPVFHCLSYEVSRSKELLGASVAGARGVYESWSKFVSTLWSRHGGIPVLYFASIDISRCFDNLNQEKVLRIATDLLRADQYVIRRYSSVSVSASGMRVHRQLRQVCPGLCDENFISYIMNKVEARPTAKRSAIFIDLVNYPVYKQPFLIQALRRHLLATFVRIGNFYLHKNLGVSQGSVLAALLNDVYYGNMEATALQDFLRSDECLLMRWVDDYLFVSTSKALADGFIDATHRNMKGFGCHINPDKTMVNFDVLFGGKPLSRIKGDWMPWCGFFFNTETLEVKHNYVQYVGQSLRDGMTVEYCSNPGRALLRKLSHAVAVRGHALLFDTLINSKHTIHLNVYQLFRFAALKFRTLVKELPNGKVLRSNLPFLSGLVLHLAAVLVSSCKKSFTKWNSPAGREGAAAGGSHVASVFKRRCPIGYLMARRICVQAFLDTLRCRRGVFCDLIRFLAKDMRYTGRRFADMESVDWDSVRGNSRIFGYIKV